MELKSLFKVLISIGLVCLTAWLVRLYYSIVTKPKNFREILRKQGVTGPPPAFLVGNILEMRKAKISSTNEVTEKAAENEPQVFHNYSASGLVPFFEQWSQKYGKLFTFALGNKQIVYVTQPEIMKEMTQSTSINLGRPSYQRKELGPLFGDGILTSNGPLWQFQKKILAPELHIDKVKGMKNLVYKSASIVVDSWKARIEANSGLADIYIDHDLLDFSGDVISRACFGSNYYQGKEIFCRLNILKDVMYKRFLSIGIPGMRYIPTKNNRVVWRLEKEIHKLILKLVKEREQSKGNPKDLFEALLGGAEDSEIGRDAKNKFIVDNCKNIYLAAQETVAISAIWCLLLLACNPDWQARVRAEVLEIWGSQIPNSAMLHKVKLLMMVIQETLRLYPLGFSLSREALKDMKIGGFYIPQGVNLWTMVSKLHTDPETWGADSFTFNPERFANGISSACKLPQSYMPFGFGPRMCLGQNLAVLELKIVVGLIVTNFSFSVSPKYIHNPVFKFGIEPKHGVHLLVKKL